METIVFRSTAIEAATFDEEKGRLAIAYRWGGIYLYYDVSRADFEALKAAPSAGEFVNQRIKPGHRYDVLKKSPPPRE